jgi:Ca-activated chloride channel family protein
MSSGTGSGYDLPSEPPRGLAGVAGQERIVLPLKAVDVWFEIFGDLAEVEMDQVFHQTASVPLDVVYSFPLPAQAAVFNCELIVNGHVTAARVEEQERAKEIAETMKAAGHRVTLVEQERENLFTLSLGNVQPNDLIVVRFAWFQILDSLQENKTFRVPFTPGIRYIPGTRLLRSDRGTGVHGDTAEVPDASRISPPRIDQLHPEAALVSVGGTLDNCLAAEGSISSPTHPVLVQPKPSSYEITLALTDTVPDRDFVLVWKEKPASQLIQRSISCSDESHCYAVVRLDAPADVPVSDCSEHDYYFLVDRSGSMAGQKWECATEGLHAFLAELGPEDRFWLTLFESHFQDFAEKPLKVSDVKRDPNFLSLRDLGVTGGTNLFPALEHLFDQISVHSANRAPIVLLITDGQIGNERAVIKLASKHREVPIHTFGIDTAVNDAFLKELAVQHHGTSALVTPNDDIVGTVSRLGYRLRRPVLTNLSVSPGWEPSRPFPDIHSNEHVLVALRGPKNGKNFEVTGKLTGAANQSYRFDLVASSAALPRLLWARQRIGGLLADEQKQEAIKLAIEQNLICEGTAFIAYDLETKVPVSSQEFYQPSIVQYAAAPAAPAFHRHPSHSRRPRPSSGDDKIAMEACALNPVRPPSTTPPNSATLDQAAAISARYPQTISERKRALIAATKSTVLNSAIGQTLLQLLIFWAEKIEDRRLRVANMLACFTVDEDLTGIEDFIQDHITEPELKTDCLWLVAQL